MIPVQRPVLGQEEAEAAATAVLSGWVAQGPRVEEFERRFAARVGATHGIAVSSCTTGLHLGLLVLGVGERDEVDVHRSRSLRRRVQCVTQVRVRCLPTLT